MFVKNNILFCLDDCLLGGNEICFEIDESYAFLYMNMESSFYFFFFLSMSSQDGVAAVLFSFFALLCSSHLVKNSPRGISLD